MSHSKLTATLLVFNHAHIITKVINSITSQTYKEFELIISDDNSNDDSYNKCINFAVKDNRIKVIKTPRNMGMAGNANFAISQTHSDWIALLHHDDILDSKCFEEWLSICEKDDTIGFVFNEYLDNNTFKKKNIKIKKSFRSKMSGKKFLKKHLLRYWGCPVRGTALIRKKYFDEIGGMNENFGLLADIDLWMRLSAKWDVGYIHKPLIEVLQERPKDYPNDYTEFSWKRLFILFDIHSSNINRNNYANYFYYIFKRFIFRNKVSFEIIKWQVYSLIKKRKDILINYPRDGYIFELWYSKFLYLIIKVL